MNIYETEAEHRFYIPKDALPRLIVPQGTQMTSTLTHIRTYTISQQWLSNGLTDAKVPYRTRIRCQRQLVPTTTRPIYTFTTKFDTPESGTIELNAPITNTEFAYLSGQYKSEMTEKTRVVAQDNETGLYYTFDLYPDQPNITVEIEFASADAAKLYEKPNWLAAIEVKE